MRLLFVILFSLYNLLANPIPAAVNIYVSGAGTSNGAGTIASPWSWDKLVAEAAKASGSLINAGDAVFIERGYDYTTPLVWNRTGTSGAPITVSAYGSGKMPNITGFTQVTAWNSLGGNLYERVLPLSTVDSLNYVLINNVPTAMGRHPNPSSLMTPNKYGWMHIESAGSSTTIVGKKTDLDSPTVRNWSGAWVSVKTSRWTLDRRLISNHTVNASGYPVLTVSTGLTYASPDGYGFFVQNDIRTLDQDGEWFFNRTTKKLTVYLAQTPSNYTIKAATQKDMLHLFSMNYVTFNGIRIEGVNRNGVRIMGSSSFLKFDGCEVQYIGERGFDGMNQNSVNDLTITNSTITDCHNYAMDFNGTGARHTYTNNTIKRIGLLFGMSTTQSGSNMMTGIRIGGGGGYHVINYNRIDSIGYAGIRWSGAHVQIRHNRITNYCMTMDDTGGIYTFGVISGSTVSLKEGSQIIKNYVGETFSGNPLQGTIKYDNPGDEASYGIYLDDASGGSASEPIIVDSNISINTHSAGLYLHNSFNIVARYNSFLGGRYSQLNIINDASRIGGASLDDDSTYGLVIKFNKCISTSTSSSQDIVKFYTWIDTPVGLSLWDEARGAAVGTNAKNGIDSNYYYKPFGSSDYVRVQTKSGYTDAQGRYTVNLSLPNFRIKYAHDVGTRTLPVRQPSNALVDTSVIFHYNTSTTDTTITITKSYIDEEGQIHWPGTITLAPWTTIALMRYEAPLPFVPPAGSSGFHVVKKQTVTGPAFTHSSGKAYIKLKPLFKENALLYSEQFDNAAWSKTGVTVSANASTAPDATTTADRVTASTATGQKQITQSLASVAGITYTLSTHVKDVDRRYVQLFFGSAGFGSAAYANYDLTTSTVTAQGASIVDRGIESLANGWKRIWITAVSTTTAASGVNNTLALIPSSTSARAVSYTPTGTYSVDVWGAQYNKGYKQDYILTTSSIVQ